MESRSSPSGAQHIRERTSRFRPDIQGLRAIAVLAVVLYHAGVQFMPGGYVGVDVFFVISGYLITSHLLEGFARDGRIGFASFYAKRARRILPASLAVLILTVIAALVWAPPLLMGEVWRGAVATALYVPNVLFAVEGTNYLAEETPSLFQHYWSLGIEEQFYLIWPLLLALGLRFLRSRKVLFVALIALVAISFAACVVLTFRNQPWAFFLLPTRAWELGVGGVVAFVLLWRPEFIAARLAAPLGWVGFVLMVAPIFTFTSATSFPGYWAAVPVVGTTLVILAGATPSRLSPSPVLSGRAMLFFGAISYSLYLVHWPALLIPQLSVGYANPLPLWITLLIAALCVPAAWLLKRYVEDPARSAPWLTGARSRRTLLSVLAGSVACVTVATAAFTYSERTRLDAGIDAVATIIADPPAATTYVPSNLTPTLRDVASDQPVTYNDGCHLQVSDVSMRDCVYGQGPRIVLFGDSHAAQWFPALLAAADEQGYSVENRTKSSCPPLSVPATNDGVPYTACDEWRSMVVDRLNDDPPALVIVSSYSWYEIGDRSAWSSALSGMLESISVPTVVIADTPNLGSTPSICLSANVHDTEACAQPRGSALGSPGRAGMQDAAIADGAIYVDLSNVICGRSCAPVVGNTLVYRDAHHLTTTYSRLLGPSLAAFLP